MIKQYLIKKTNRETLSYKILDQLIFNILKVKARILHNISDKDSYFKLMGRKVKRIHLGAGSKLFKGFLNSDILGSNPIDITKPLPFPDSSIDLIYSSNLVEHIYLIEFKRFLKETYRVLKPKGSTIIVTPSLKAIFDNKTELEPLIERYTDTSSTLKSKTFSEYLNYLMHIGYGHKYLYDSDLIIFLAKKIGFSKAEVIDYKKIGNKEIVDSLSMDKTTLKIAETVRLIK